MLVSGNSYASDVLRVNRNFFSVKARLILLNKRKQMEFVNQSEVPAILAKVKNQFCLALTVEEDGCPDFDPSDDLPDWDFATELYKACPYLKKLNPQGYQLLGNSFLIFDDYGHELLDWLSQTHHSFNKDSRNTSYTGPMEVLAVLYDKNGEVMYRNTMHYA